MTIAELIEMLTKKESKSACSASSDLSNLSTESSEIYPYMDYFFSLLEDKNSLVRNRALMLISANARWDKNNIINSKIEEYISHILDEKPITARQCIKNLPEIAYFKPELSEIIINALESTDFSGYADSMIPLLKRDVASAINTIGVKSD